MRRLMRAAGLGAALLSGSSLPVAAQQIVSSYTDLDLDVLCTVVQSDDFGSTWACPGLKGIPVMVTETDRRMFVSYGLTSTTEKAAKQTPAPVNRIDETIEWRVSNAEGYFKPFATILRYYTQAEGGAEKQVLVVAKVAPGATCHIAYVDVGANPDADTLARKVADESAPGFDCETDELLYPGTFEAWER